ncbi:DUF3616 domain-containing protein [Merismopedia glauca]|uniref:DUF3616 domain-containing protein n=1 Tax=Merismopedia glauca CCAP 1448/3 TaxID=1296344 RepID=A0A2T1C8M9_9CYAN|nr:DUF3616 domain-containing protein [Merismopedia glauca]PSB04594.1 DUF3616 domain-containing protein [Merismopedia glauca CCAP 1448/3]
MQKINFSIEKELQHYGICDASGAVPIDENRFIVANDEDKKDIFLRVYDSNNSGKWLEKIRINDYFTNNPEGDEVDLEAGTQIGDIFYWITSHGRNKKTKRKEERHQFFANEITKPEKLILKQVGKSYTQLVLKDMLEEDSRFEDYKLKEAETLAPKAEGGLNIEGLTATPTGELLIGFRNPIPQGKALLIPLKNPRDLLQENDDTVKASFGNPIELDLGGLGIRSIEYWKEYQIYLIVAGAYDTSDKFGLYSWSGNDREPPIKIELPNLPSQFKPESVLFYPQKPNHLQLLSDDGSIARVNNTQCKDIKDEDSPEKYFRSLWIKVN